MTGDEPGDLFERVLLPVASEEDARRIESDILPYLAGTDATVIVVHVVETVDGGVDPSPVDVQEEAAAELFDLVTRGARGMTIETRTAYGSDVAEALVETAREVDATVVAFSPREKGLLMRLLTGDTARSLMANPDVPVLAIPHGRE